MMSLWQKDNLTLPRYDGQSTVNLISTLLMQFGVQAMPLRPLEQELLPTGLFVGVKHVVFVVVDALGYHQLAQYIDSGSMPHVQNLIKRVNQGAGAFFPLTTVFPSTTAAALTSLYTGLVPAKHGLLSYAVYLPEIGDVADLVFSRLYSGAKIDSFKPFLQQPSVFERLSDVGVMSLSISDKAFQGSLLSAVHHRGSVFQGYRFSSSIPTLVARSLQVSSEQSFTTIYWPGVDSCAHKYGPQSEECEDEAYMVDSIIGRVIQKLGAVKGSLDDFLFVLTADHGQVLIDEAQSLELNAEPDLLSMLRILPSGERRSLYLYPKAGEEKAVRQWAEDRGALVFSRQEAFESGLLGEEPISPLFAERIGELIVFPPGTAQWIYDPGNSRPVHYFKGAHGGLHADEMFVPCLMIRL
jgi:predicted AlkP superfamily pyrophosphatase or phosphodiesterase